MTYRSKIDENNIINPNNKQKLNFIMKKFTFLLAALFCATMSFAETKTDKLTSKTIGSPTSYTEFKNIKVTSDAVYAGQATTGTISNAGAIQMRSKSSNSGIVSTTSGGTIKSVAITVKSGKNTINVYGSNTAYTAATDLYDNGKQGELVGTLSATGTVTITGNYAYVGVRSADGAIYLTDISFEWGETKIVDATDIKLDQTTLSLEQYKYTTLAATLTPAESTTEVVWSSTDEKVATVENGKVTAVGVGTTTITATAGTVSDECAVTVTAATPITVAQAVEIAKTVSANNEIAAGGMYVIRGYVTKQYGTPSSDMSKYGNYSVWLADTKDGGEVFEAYQVVPTDGETIVEVGDYVEVIADITKYNTIYETVGKTGTISIINKATYTITPLANDANMGNVKGYGVYTRGETATIYAVAYNGFEFVNWTDADNKEVSTNTDYSFTVTGDVTYTANFKALTFIVQTYVNDETMGSVEGAPEDNVAYGTEITLTAKPNTGYKFVNWTNADTEEEVSKEATYTFKVKEDIMLQANFIKDTSTAIDATESAKTVVKTLENGVLYILRDGIRYNAQGVVVE